MKICVGSFALWRAERILRTFANGVNSDPNAKSEQGHHCLRPNKVLLGLANSVNQDQTPQNKCGVWLGSSLFLNLQEYLYSLQQMKQLWHYLNLKWICDCLLSNIAKLLYILVWKAIFSKMWKWRFHGKTSCARFCNEWLKTSVRLVEGN